VSDGIDLLVIFVRPHIFPKFGKLWPTQAEAILPWNILTHCCGHCQCVHIMHFCYICDPETCPRWHWFWFLYIPTFSRNLAYKRRR